MELEGVQNEKLIVSKTVGEYAAVSVEALRILELVRPCDVDVAIESLSKAYTFLISGNHENRSQFEPFVLPAMSPYTESRKYSTRSLVKRYDEIRDSTWGKSTFDQTWENKSGLTQVTDGGVFVMPFQASANIAILNHELDSPDPLLHYCGYRFNEINKDHRFNQLELSRQAQIGERSSDKLSRIKQANLDYKFGRITLEERREISKGLYSEHSMIAAELVMIALQRRIKGEKIPLDKGVMRFPSMKISTYRRLFGGKAIEVPNARRIGGRFYFESDDGSADSKTGVGRVISFRI